MAAGRAFEQALTASERRIMARLKSPRAIQDFLDTVAYSTEEAYRCPLRVLRERIGHCFDGALFAAAALRRLGYPPLIVDLLPNDRDDDHLLAVYKKDDRWGAVAKSNFSGLRWREPVYRTIRELVMSYFEPYFNAARERTLRGYTRPLNLRSFDGHDWTTRDAPLDLIGERLDTIQQYPVLTRRMISHLTKVDERSFRSGMLGIMVEGLYRLPRP